MTEPRFDSETGKSKCIVMLNNINIPCGVEIKGENPTNLKVHLQTNHRKEYKPFMAKDSERKATNDKVGESAGAQTQLGKQQTLDIVLTKVGGLANKFKLI